MPETLVGANAIHCDPQACAPKLFCSMLHKKGAPFDRGAFATAAVMTLRIESSQAVFEILSLRYITLSNHALFRQEHVEQRELAHFLPSR
jgi:hypothetical protein